MAIRKPVVQTAQILAGTLVQEIDLRQGMDDGRGNTTPDNVVVELTFSAMSAAETLDITGLMVGSSTYVTASIVTQIDANAAASTVTKTVLCSPSVDAARGCMKLKFTATNIASAETIDIKVLTW